MDNQSLAHSRYNCTYHIVFIPKYRQKVMFGALRKVVLVVEPYGRDWQSYKICHNS